MGCSIRRLSNQPRSLFLQASTVLPDSGLFRSNNFWSSRSERACECYKQNERIDVLNESILKIKRVLNSDVLVGTLKIDIDRNLKNCKIKEKEEIDIWELNWYYVYNKEGKSMNKTIRILFIVCSFVFIFHINSVIFAENVEYIDCEANIKSVLVMKEEKVISILFDGPRMASDAFTYVVQNDGTAAIVGYTGKDDIVSIPSDLDGHYVSAIGPYVFEGHDEIEKIFMWADVIYIGKSAFKGCFGLTSIEIPSECMLIDTSAFEGCIGMSTVLLKGDPDIADKAFYGCESLQEIDIGPETKFIGKSAFEGCNSLYKVVIWGDSEIGSRAFYGCGRLHNVVIFGEDNEIGTAAFGNCPNLDEIDFWGISKWKPSNDSQEVFSENSNITKDASQVQETEIAEETDAAEETDVAEEMDAAEEMDVAEKTEPIDGMRPEFKKAMDSYEEFYNSYYDLLKKYEKNPTDFGLLTEYINMMEKAEEMDEALEAWDEDEMNDAELDYYLEVTNRILMKTAGI